MKTCQDCGAYDEGFCYSFVYENSKQTQRVRVTKENKACENFIDRKEKK